MKKERVIMVITIIARAPLLTKATLSITSLLNPIQVVRFLYIYYVCLIESRRTRLQRKGSNKGDSDQERVVDTNIKMFDKSIEFSVSQQKQSSTIGIFKKTNL